MIAGLRVGVWKNWLEMEGYVNVEESRYQSCTSREEAFGIYTQAKNEGRVRILTK